MNQTSTRLACALAVTLLLAPAAFAQDADDDAVLKPAEPDFTLVNLPTGLRLPAGKGAFQVTHRFGLGFNNGERFSDYAGALFGLDDSAVTSLEVRVGIVKNGQVGILHSSDNRTWNFFGQYGLVRQDHGLPVDISALGGVDLIREPVPGTATFDRKSAPSIGAIVSRTFGEHAALYAEPFYVSNIYNEFNTVSSKDNGVLIGVGARLRIGSSSYLVAETTPRVSGFKANQNPIAFGLEKRVGGHVFQLNVSNSFGTSISQMAMGGDPANSWHIGFNISRKFF